MTRSTFTVILVLAGFTSFGCMSIRDRIAVRMGLPIKAVKDQQRMARYKARVPQEKAQAPTMLVQAAPVSAPAIEPAPEIEARQWTSLGAPPVERKLVVSLVYPELSPAPEPPKKNWDKELSRYSLEKEAARLRWETALLKLQAEELRRQVASLDQEYTAMSTKVAVLESERSRIRESMAKVESDMEKAKALADQIEAAWDQFAAMPASESRSGNGL